MNSMLVRLYKRFLPDPLREKLLSLLLIEIQDVFIDFAL